MKNEMYFAVKSEEQDKMNRVSDVVDNWRRWSISDEQAINKISEILESLD